MSKIQDLRAHLFDVIEKLKDDKISVEKAKAISEVSQTIINSAKVEVDYLRAADKMAGMFPKTGFIEQK